MTRDQAIKILVEYHTTKIPLINTYEMKNLPYATYKNTGQPNKLLLNMAWKTLAKYINSEK